MRSIWKVYRHFPELWRMRDAIRGATGMLVRHANAHVSAIGQYTLQDGTEAETHAALIHACEPGSGCAWLEEDARSPGHRPRRAQTLAAADSRRSESAGPEQDHDGLLIGDAEKMEFDEQGRIVITTTSGHRFVSRDVTAGVRMYDGNRGGVSFWHGFLDARASTTQRVSGWSASSSPARFRNTTFTTPSPQRRQGRPAALDGADAAEGDREVRS
jgi:hypothetical protein